MLTLLVVALLSKHSSVAIQASDLRIAAAPAVTAASIEAVAAKVAVAVAASMAALNNAMYVYTVLIYTDLDRDMCSSR
jgi:hypothetical protein